MKTNDVLLRNEKLWRRTRRLNFYGVLRNDVVGVAAAAELCGGDGHSSCCCCC